MNAFDRLVNDLREKKIDIRMIDIAVMTWINSRTDIPDGIKNLLVQQETGKGLVRTLFRQINETIGSVEIAYRRGEQKESD